MVPCLTHCPLWKGPFKKLDASYTWAFICKWFNSIDSDSLWFKCSYIIFEIYRHVCFRDACQFKSTVFGMQQRYTYIYIYIYIYIYMIWECYRTQNIFYTYNESINDDKTTLFTHPPRVSLARFTLLETSQLISDDVTMTWQLLPDHMNSDI